MTSIGTRIKKAMITKPRKFQIQAVRFLEKNNGRGVLGDDMGLGKTYDAIAWFKIRPDVTRIVIVCPSNVKYQWQEQFEIHAGIDAEVLEGSKPYKPSSAVSIINYKILATARWPDGKGSDPVFPWVKKLRQFNPQAVVLDEFHYIKNLEALRTKACKKLSHDRPHVFGASGTPIEKCPADFFPMLNLVAPQEFSSFWKYGMRYCDPENVHGRLEFNGADNLEELHERISHWMIRRLKRDVAKELPPKIRTLIPIRITNRREYDEAAKNFLEWLANLQGEAAATRARRAESLVKMGVLKRIAAEGKLKAMCSWVEDFLETGEKLILFCVHKKILQAFLDTFPGSAFVRGGMTARKKRDQVNRFRKDKKCKLFVGQLRAAGTGTDGLHEAASTVLFPELGWNFTDHEQAEDRALRIGQTAKCVSVYYGLAQNTIEEKILELLQSKADICNRVLEGKTLEKELFERSKFNGFRI